MPKGRKYTPSDLMLLREEGILTPSEIRALPIQEEPDTPLRGAQIPGVGTIVSLTPKKQGAKGGTRRSRSQGYKYFPDN